MRHRYATLTLPVALLVAGCVIIPYRPGAETRHDQAAIANPGQLRLSVGPREFLEDMTEAVSKQDRRVEPVDGQTFIDTASPAGELTLARLLDPTTRDLIAPLQLDYVVLLAEPASKIIDDKGGYVFYLGFFGLGKTRESTTYWAAVFDARQLQMIEQLNSESVGTDAGIGLFYGLFVVSDTSGSARKDVVRHIVETIATARPTGPVRVVFTAVEPIPTPEQLEKEAQRRDLATPQWAPERYPSFVAAPPPPAGQALVYLYRPAASDYAFVSMDFYRGTPGSEVYISRLFNGGYFPFYAPEGELDLGMKRQFRTTAAPGTLSVAAGETYYLRGGTEQSFWHGTSPTLVVVDPAKALPQLEKCRLMPSVRDYDLETARRAELGDRTAQLRLGTLNATGVSYADGTSLPVDYAEAYKWALVSKNDFALKSLRKKMDATQIAEAEKLARDWQSANP
jgi:hypothetical protein